MPISETEFSVENIDDDSSASASAFLVGCEASCDDGSDSGTSSFKNSDTGERSSPSPPTSKPSDNLPCDKRESCRMCLIVLPKSSPSLAMKFCLLSNKFLLRSLVLSSNATATSPLCLLAFTLTRKLCRCLVASAPTCFKRVAPEDPSK